MTGSDIADEIGYTTWKKEDPSNWNISRQRLIQLLRAYTISYSTSPKKQFAI
jgi:hypothetical protein